MVAWYVAVVYTDGNPLNLIGNRTLGTDIHRLLTINSVVQYVKMEIQELISKALSRFHSFWSYHNIAIFILKVQYSNIEVLQVCFRGRLLDINLYCFLMGVFQAKWINFCIKYIDSGWRKI